VKLSVHVGDNATISGSNDPQILALEASFGAGLPKTKADALSFSLAQMQPLLACSDPLPPLPSFQGQAVLVQRGDCSFASKALRVQRLGAAAVIVINSEEGIIGMGCNETDLTEGVVTIPVVMVSNSSGQFLLRALSNASASASASASAAPVTVSLYAPPRSLLDVAELVLWALALLSLVGASAWAAAEEKAALEGKSGAGQSLADQFGVGDDGGGVRFHARMCRHQPACNMSVGSASACAPVSPIHVSSSPLPLSLPAPGRPLWSIRHVSGVSGGVRGDAAATPAHVHLFISPLSSPILQPQGDSSGAYDMSVGSAVGFVVMSSVMLLLLFFLMSPLVFYIILTLFCVAALEVRNIRIAKGAE
ncbi:unnamed protein product, partial [Closterium sp. NIES-54]